jgi:hypothetical protein
VVTWVSVWLGLHHPVASRAERFVGLHVKCVLLLSDFKQNWNVSTNFSKNSRISNLMKIRSAVLEADRRMFATFSCERAENYWVIVKTICYI